MSEGLLRTALDNVQDQVFVMAPDGRILALTAPARRWLGVTEEQAVGRIIADLADDSAVVAANLSLLRDMPELLAHLAETGDGFGEDEMTLYDGRGRLQVTSTRLDPLIHPDHGPLLVWTVRHLNEQRIIFRASSVAMARVDIGGHLLQANRAFQNLVARSEEDLAGVQLRSLVAETDLDTWSRDLAPLLDGHCESVVGEHRLRRPDGTMVWTRSTLSRVPGTRPWDTFLLGVWEDITERRRAEESLARESRHRQALAHIGTVALAARDEHALLNSVADHLMQVVHCTGVAVRIWGDPSAGDESGVAVERRGDDDPPPDPATHTCTAEVGRDGAVMGRLSVDFTLPGDPGSADLASSADRTLADGAASFLAMALARLRAESEILFHTLHDPLTGLANRRLLMQRMAEALPSCRPGRSVGALFVDLDGFKPINDVHGHAAGDMVLQLVGRRLRTLVRDGDTVARIGGDEFVVLCPDIVPQALRRLAERITVTVAEPIMVPGDGGPVEVRPSASIGTALGDAATSADQLLTAADARMYQRKRAKGIHRDVIRDGMHEEAPAAGRR